MAQHAIEFSEPPDEEELLDEEELIEYVIDRIIFNEQDVVVDPELETERGWGADTSYLDDDFSIISDKDFRVRRKTGKLKVEKKAKGKPKRKVTAIKKKKVRKIKKMVKPKKTKFAKKKLAIKRIPKLSSRKKLEAAIKKARRFFESSEE